MKLRKALYYPYHWFFTATKLVLLTLDLVKELQTLEPEMEAASY
jgi:hypothetical protein